MGENRFYREWVDSGLVSFTARVAESDIYISAEEDLKSEAERLIRKYRYDIEEHIRRDPEFKTSLKPLPPDDEAPSIVKSMLNAGKLTGVGPMAAVAGAISEYVGKGLLDSTRQIILENGGDIFIKTDIERKATVYAGQSPLSGKISIKIDPGYTPLGICTSSGTVGHSLSFGKADAVCVISQDTALADACATATCNMVRGEGDIEEALDFAKKIEGIIGAVVIYGKKLGVRGDVEIA
ncbi:MAG: UPF0280 family protein [Candidatus Omnitrophota bacterium]